MKLPMVVVGILVGAVLGTVGLVVYPLLGLLPPLLGICIGACVGGIAGICTSKRLVIDEQNLRSLPKSTIEFIMLVIKKMRYRKEVRADVQAELAAHFVDELEDCATDEERQQKAQQLIENFGDAKLLGTLLRRAKKRCRPLWRTIVARTFQTVGVLILYFIAYCVYISLGKPTININYVEEATKLVRPVADESLNAAPIYQKAIDAYREPPLIKDETGADEDLLDAVKAKTWITELTEEELALLKQWLSENTDAVEFFKQAGEKPYYWREHEINDKLILDDKKMSSIGKIAAMIVWQAKLKAYDGHIEGAFDDLLACYRAGRHFKGPHFLFEQLSGMGIQSRSIHGVFEVLNNQKVDSILMKNLHNRFEELMTGDTYTFNFEIERFCYLDRLQRCYTDNGSGSGHMIPGRIQEVLDEETSGIADNWGYGNFWAISIISVNRGDIRQFLEKSFSLAKEKAYKTPWQWHNECADFEMDADNWSTLKKIRYWRYWPWLDSFYVYNSPTFTRWAYYHKTLADALITTLALIRFKLSSGDYPESLEDLVTAGYLKSLPMDPFSEQPLVYKKTDNGFMLYSVGFNFKDDGGQVYHNEEGKIRLWEGDAVFWPVQK